VLKYLNTAFELLGDDVNLNDDRLGMLDVPGVGPDQLSLLFHASNEMWISKLWQTLSVPPWLDQTDEVFVQVLGKGGRCPPMLNIYYDRDDAFVQTKHGAEEERRGHISFTLSKLYDGRRMSFVDIDALSEYGIRAMDADAYPSLRFVRHVLGKTCYSSCCLYIALHNGFVTLVRFTYCVVCGGTGKRNANVSTVRDHDGPLCCPCTRQIGQLWCIGVAAVRNSNRALLQTSLHSLWCAPS